MHFLNGKKSKHMNSIYSQGSRSFMVFQFFKTGFQALQSALKKTRSRLAKRLSDLFSGPINEEMLDELEEIFYEADLGVKTSQELTEKTRAFLKKNKEASS